MDNIDRRKHERIPLFNPIFCSGFDAFGNTLVQNISLVLNASQNGIQIETFTEIQSENVRLKFLDSRKNTIEIEGKVVYCERSQSGIFKTGIRLMGKESENVNFVKKLLQMYHCIKENRRPGIVQKERNSQSNNIDTINL
jgi:hypothetical protein